MALTKYMFKAKAHAVHLVKWQYSCDKLLQTAVDWFLQVAPKIFKWVQPSQAKNGKTNLQYFKIVWSKTRSQYDGNSEAKQE